jgi:cation:H+ antiporter
MLIPAGLEILALPVFLLGVFFLYKGSDYLVDGTSKTAAQLGISSLIISVILVGFGTSAPEFAISVGAALQHNSDISLGNIIGSCIANLLLVLGISALIRPITINKRILKREYLLVLGATAILLIAAYIGLLDTYRLVGGVLFLVLFIAFVLFFIRCARIERLNNKIKYDKGKTQKNLLFTLIGIAGVIIGAWFLIDSAVTIATVFHIPTFFIAISMVAVGTSVPELVVSAMAAYKNESDIAVGNVLGSNVFNILLILGFAALFIPLHASPVNSVSFIQILILLGISLFMFPVLITGTKISRKEAAIMLTIYAVYLWYSSPL